MKNEISKYKKKNTEKYCEFHSVHMPLNRHTNLLYHRPQKKTDTVEKLCSGTRPVTGQNENKKESAQISIWIDESRLYFMGLIKTGPT